MVKDFLKKIKGSKFLHIGKDGGPESSVKGFWLFEIKPLASLAVLKFEGKSREAFHEHAFNSISWLLKGQLIEEEIINFEEATDLVGHVETRIKTHFPSFKPIIIRRDTFHKVDSVNNSIVFTIRGPWADEWKEMDLKNNTLTVLSSGRIIKDILSNVTQ